MPDAHQKQSHQPHFHQFAQHLGRHFVASICIGGTEIRRHILVFQITPALMRAFGDRADGDQFGTQPDPGPPLPVIHEAEYRAAADERVVQYPIKRAADHLLVPLWQIARGQPDFACLGIGFQPLAQMRGTFGAEGNFGHMERHGRYLGVQVLARKTGKHRKSEEDQEAHGIGNHCHENRARNRRVLIEPVEEYGDGDA